MLSGENPEFIVRGGPRFCCPWRMQILLSGEDPEFITPAPSVGVFHPQTKEKSGARSKSANTPTDSPLFSSPCHCWQPKERGRLGLPSGRRFIGSNKYALWTCQSHNTDTR